MLVKSLVFTNSLLTLSALSLIILASSRNSFTWDIEHELYFGSRLLSGELMWVNEFHDKLPFLQFLVAPFSGFQSHAPWVLFSATVATIAAALIFIGLKNTFESEGVSARLSRGFALFGASLYVSLTGLLPDDFTAINSLATSLSVISVYVLLKTLFLGPATSIGNTLLFLSSALTAAVSMSVRPYFAGTFFVVMLALVFSPYVRSFMNTPRNRWFVTSLWFAITSAFTILINLFPFVIHNHVPTFISGIRALSSKLNPNSFFDSFASSFQPGLVTNLPLLVAYLGPLILLLAYLLFKPLRVGSGEIVLWMGSMAGGLVVTAMTKHWWNHYSVMLVGFSAVGLTVIVQKLTSLRGHYSKASIALTSALVLLVGVFVAGGSVGRVLVATPIESHREAGLVREIEAVLNTKDIADRDFLAIDSMFVHWQINEPRHGFPSSANSYQIAVGWFEGVSMGPGFPTNVKEYCQAIAARGPSLMILSANSPFLECMEDSEVQAYDQFKPNTMISGSYLYFQRNR